MMATLMRFFTCSPYTHTGMALWLHGEPWLLELNSGRNRP